jgi:hypothetical protein
VLKIRIYMDPYHFGSWIRIKVKNMIRIKVKNRIRIRIKAKNRIRIGVKRWKPLSYFGVLEGPNMEKS